MDGRRSRLGPFRGVSTFARWRWTLLGAASLLAAPATAGAGALDGVTGAVGEVTAPVKQATEAVTVPAVTVPPPPEVPVLPPTPPPLPPVSVPVTPPVTTPPLPSVPPVKVPSVVPQTAAPAVGKTAASAAAGATETVTKTAGTATKAAGDAAAGVEQTTAGAVGTAGGTGSLPGAGAGGTGRTAEANRGGGSLQRPVDAAQAAGAPEIPGSARDRAAGGAQSRAGGNEAPPLGAIRAPFDRSPFIFVWPAIALERAWLGTFLSDWSRATLARFTRHGTDSLRGGEAPATGTRQIALGEAVASSSTTSEPFGLPNWIPGGGAAVPALLFVLALALGIPAIVMVCRRELGLPSFAKRWRARV